MTDLAVTSRCERDDLGSLPPEVAAHVLEVFQERRGLDPESGETMRVGWVSNVASNCTPSR